MGKGAMGETTKPLYPQIPFEKLGVKMEEEGDMKGAFFKKYCEDKKLSIDKLAEHPDTNKPMPNSDINEIKENILDVVGNTPMVKCDRLAKHFGIECQLLAKCEFMNPGGAVKDRIARRMIYNAEKDGFLFCSDKKVNVEFKKGDILIEPTSGNTGIGLAMAAAVLDYKAIICMPEKMSQEKQDALKGLGATIVRTPTEYAWDHRDSHIGVAYRLKQELNEKRLKDPSLPRAHVLDQYSNIGNPMAHYDETGEEIWRQCDGKIDYLFAGAGTGGTISGIAKKLKERDPNITIVAVDPNGSILCPDDAMNEANEPSKIGQVVEGIGYDFIPRVLDRSDDLIDEWMKGPDKDSFTMAREMLAREGFMCGGSCGTAMDAAVRYCQGFPDKAGKPTKPPVPRGKTVVVVLPDNLRNYMTKHLNDDWMYEREYITEEECAYRFEPKHIANNDWGQDMTVADLNLHKASFLLIDTTCQEAIHRMRTQGFDQFPVKDENDNIYGVLTATNLLSRLGKNQLKLMDPIKRAVVRDLRNVSMGVKLNELVRILQRNSFVLIDKKYFVTFSDIFDMRSPPTDEIDRLRAELVTLKERSNSNTLLIGAALGVVAAAAFSYFRGR
jgi:cystathionine beta-synthase